MVKVKILVQFYFFGSKMLKCQNMINNKRAKSFSKKKEKENEKEKKKEQIELCKKLYDLNNIRFINCHSNFFFFFFLF